MKKLVYLTVTAPFGQSEAFLIPEMNCLVRQGVDLVIIPVRPAGRVFHLDGAGLVSRAVVSGLFSRKIWLLVISWLIRAPFRTLGLLLLLVKGGSPANKIKNLLVFPKSLFIAGQVRSLGAGHIHAHWASTPSTCALVASALTGVDWSFTAHRWDIVNDNLVREKVRRSSFVRVISSNGREEIIKAAGRQASEKVILNPMGVEVPEKPQERVREGKKRPVIAAVGNLTPLKGHRFLLQACRIMADRGLDFKCLIIGDGPERNNLSRLAERLMLGKIVILAGALPHHRVLQMYRAGAISLLVHPSVETPGGEREGVPVAVMEAMACGVPVVVTDTGGIGDLVDEESGLIVPPEEPVLLARAIESLLKDPARTRSLAGSARRRVEEKFNLCRNVSVLLGRMGVAP